MEPSNKPLSCHGCPAFGKGIGFVPPSGPRDAAIAYLGHIEEKSKYGWGTDGEQQALFSTPFVEVAPSGHRLTKWIRRGGGQRTGVLLMNVVQCWLPKTLLGPNRGKGSREPSWSEMAYCWKQHVGPFIHALVTGGSLVHVATVGAPATRWMRQEQEGGFEKWVGNRMEVEVPGIE
jgi:hypothetical protein